MNTSLLRGAFLSMNGGMSLDRVVADPELNARYLKACRECGLDGSEEQLNRALLNLRKSSALKDVKTTERTSVDHQEECSFAGEMAIRFLERRDGITLDDVVCSPSRVAEFDKVAARVCPGFSPLEYRWAALNLRKRKKLKPELVARVYPPIDVRNIDVGSLDLSNVPASQGIYIFFESHQALYVGESSNLRHRISKHLEHSDNKGLARWLWEQGSGDLNLELQLLPDATPTRIRRALESELIQSRNPIFNVLGR